MNKDIKVLLKEARKQGFEHEPCKRGRIVTNPQTRQSTVVYSDTSGPRGVENTRSDLRSIGFQDPRRPQKPGRTPRTPAAPAAAHPKEPCMPDVPAPRADIDSTIDEIRNDIPTAVWAVMARLRELAAEAGGPVRSRRINGEEVFGRYWSGDLRKAVLEDIWKELADAPTEAMKSIQQPLINAMLGEKIQVEIKGGIANWFVPNEHQPGTPAGKPPAQEPVKAAAPRPAPTPAPPPAPNSPPRPDHVPMPFQAPLPDPAPAKPVPAKAEPAPRRKPAGYACEKCCYVGNTPDALNAHINRTPGEHIEDDGAPFACAAKLKEITDRDYDCPVQAPTMESLINHMRRHHKPMVDGLQFCRFCFQAIEGGRAEMAKHQLTHTGSDGPRRPGPPKKNGSPTPPRAEPARTITATVPAASPPAVAGALDVAGMDLDKFVEAIKTMAHQAKLADEERRALQERMRRLEAERDKALAELEGLRSSGDPERLAELEAENERLRKENEAFDQIRNGMMALMKQGND